MQPIRESRLKKIGEAKAALEAEARIEAKRTPAKSDNATGVPADKAQRNFTDPQSCIMPLSGGQQFEQAYNAQAAMDSTSQIIVAAEVTD